jgi:hypothetical protein
MPDVRRLVENIYKWPAKSFCFSVHLPLHSKLFFRRKGKRRQRKLVSGHTISLTYCGKLRRKRSLNRVPGRCGYFVCRQGLVPSVGQGEVAGEVG